ncbi:TPA: hypothetical protein N2D99_002047 [Clostridium botulinum]|nr:hypothetical protein [Clostridium botulinum]
MYNLKHETMHYSCNRCGIDFEEDGNKREKVYDSRCFTDATLLKTFYSVRKGIK